jgi:hypothetical protein
MMRDSSTPFPSVPAQTAENKQVGSSTASGAGNAGALAARTTGGSAAPLFVEYESTLFELYKRFRYNELLCGRLMRKSLRVEKWVRVSVLITLAISLSTGVIPGMNQATLNWIWASFTTAATLLTIYSLMVGSGSMQFRWFQLAMRFHASSSSVEFFTLQVKRGKFSEDDLTETWRDFRRELDFLIDGAGPGFLEFASKHQDELTEELEATLRRESKAAG